MLNKFFKIISGTPKSGNISECLSPIITAVQMAIVGYILGLVAYNDPIYKQFLYFTFLTAILWQIGWGMSTKRFIIYEKSLKEKKIGQVKEVIRPYILITKIILSIAIDLIAISISIDYIRYILLFISMFFAWQSGWSINIVRTESNK